MVYVTRGEFTLGTKQAQTEAWIKEHPKDERNSFADEKPQCRVNLPSYWIGRTEVTNAQYQRFIRATGHRAPDYWEGGQVPSGLESFPVVSVDWVDARAYCEWAGGHLPTELQWEKAARGADGRVFPWGNQWDSKRCRNFGLVTGAEYATAEEYNRAGERWLSNHDDVREGPAAVGSCPAGASPYGCLDMAGNVWQWCADWYYEKAYQRDAKSDLTPPASGTDKVQRGGSWPIDIPWYFRCAHRLNCDPVNPCVGFRCAGGPK